MSQMYYCYHCGITFFRNTNMYQTIKCDQCDLELESVSAIEEQEDEY